MNTIVSKSSSIVVGRPLEPLTMSDGTTIKLSPLDRGNFPMTVLLLYEHPINNAANTIKTALSQALVHYYPFSGRLVPGGDGISSTGSYIDCTGEGVAEFISASADCSLKQAAKLFERSSSSSGGGGTGTNSLLDELTRCNPAGGYGATDPLLSVQLTEFTCGGFILGVTWSHAIADGAGIAQFLGAIGELARGLMSPSILPVRWDEAVSSLPPPPGSVRDVELEHSPLVVLDVTIPSSFISRNKSKAEFHGQPRCTTFEVAAAVLWQCRTRATMSICRPDTLSALSFTVNVRKHVGAKDGYYGNCVVNQHVMATSGAVAGADIMDLVKMIKQAKDQVPDLLDKKRNESSKNRLQGLDGRYNMFAVTSWRNIGFEEADFGSGPPARVMWHEPGIPPFPICFICPNKGEDDVSVVSFCVKEEHADAFLQEIAKFTSI
ncbi:acyl transferase 15-like [Miscanthus floridulus]|uniref:acyl transferase 15-like n=1 Tax=Miscanthus floridulus TaxID=154761 RepID=UPI00345B429C